MGINLFEDILNHDKAFEFFINYLADAERTVELTEELDLKAFFPPQHGLAFDKHRADETNHATILDSLLRENGFELFPMKEEFQIIAKFKRAFGRHVDRTQLAHWAGYFYCAEKSAFEAFSNLYKQWKDSNSPRAKQALAILEKILRDEKEHMRFAWSLILENSKSEKEARDLVKKINVSYKLMAEKTVSLLVSRLKDLIVSEPQNWLQPLAWKGASLALELKTMNASSRSQMLLNSV